MKKDRPLIKEILIGILTLIVYFPTFIWMWDRWFATESYYGHGVLIPIVSGFLIWIKKDILVKIERKGDDLGWVFLLSGLFIHVVSSLWRIYFTSAFSLILSIAGLVLLFLGKKILKEIIFPILFLVFMIPLPLWGIAGLTFRMKVLAAQISTFIVNRIIGIPAVRDGSLIMMTKTHLMVENPCSGLRSLIALMALGALVSYLKEFSNIKKVILFLSSAIFATLGNVTRIVFLCFMSEVYGPKYTRGIYETIAGLMVFIVAFIGLVVFGRFLGGKYASFKEVTESPVKGKSNGKGI